MFNKKEKSLAEKQWRAGLIQSEQNMKTPTVSHKTLYYIEIHGENLELSAEEAKELYNNLYDALDANGQIT